MLYVICSMEKGICYGSFVMVHTTIVQRNACDNANMNDNFRIKVPCRKEREKK